MKIYRLSFITSDYLALREIRKLTKSRWKSYNVSTLLVSLYPLSILTAVMSQVASRVQYTKRIPCCIVLLPRIWS
jgi:hypothetical protein